MFENEKPDSLSDLWELRQKQNAPPTSSDMNGGSPESEPQVVERAAKRKLFDSVFGPDLDTIPNRPDEIGEFCNGRYKVEALFDEGGLGALYLARDTELGRLVIVKAIRASHSDDHDSQRQFVNEAAITGQLEHPGIVPIYGFGRDQHRRPYYTMQKIKGTKLSEEIRQFHEHRANDGGHIKAFQRLLEDFRSVCLTIHFAHSRNVIHRDIKPDNIMVGKFGEVLVIDWGLAKQISATDSLSAPARDMPQVDEFEPIAVPNAFQTRHGAVKGSPIYMSPEQSEGSTAKIGPASDIYGLGATLYQVVTGRPPFEGSSQEVLLQVKEGKVRPPSQVAADVPLALEAICLKAMQRDPDQRYQTAKDLAEDVECFLAGEPVSAYNEPWTDTVQRWGRRNKTLVASTITFFMVVLVALVSTSVLLTKYNADLFIAKNAAETATTAEQQRANELEKSLYVNQIMLAQAAWNEPDLHRTSDILDATTLGRRSLEWNYAKRLVTRVNDLAWNQPPAIEPTWINSLTSSANGAWLMATFEQESAFEPGKFHEPIKVIPTTDNVSRVPKLSLISLAATFGVPAQILCFSPSGDEVLCRVPSENGGTERQYRLALVGIQTGQAIWQTEPLTDDSTSIFKAGFLMPEPIADPLKSPQVGESPDRQSGSQIVVMTDPQVISPELGTTGRVARIEFRDALTGGFLKTFETNTNIVAERACFSPNGQRIALMDMLNVTVFSVIADDSPQTLTGDNGFFFCDVAFSPDASLMATASADHAVRIWDAVSGSSIQVLWGMRKRVRCLAFDPSGNRIAACGEEGAIRIWDLKDGKLLNVLPTKDTETYTITFSHDGSQIYSGGSDGVIRHYDLDEPPVARTIQHENRVSQVQLNSQGDTIAAIIGWAENSKVCVYDRQSARLKFETDLYDARYPSEALFVGDIDFSPDGKTLAIGGDNVVHLVDADTGAKRWEHRGLEGRLKFTSDGRHLIASRKRRFFIQVIKEEALLDRVLGAEAKEVIGEVVQNWEERTLDKRLWYDDGDEKILQYLAKDPGNEQLIALITSNARSAQVTVDVSAGKIQKVLDCDAVFGNAIALHPSLPVIAVAENDRVSLRDIDSGKSLSQLEIGVERPTHLAFSPDGNRLVLSSEWESTVAVVDIESGTAAFRLVGHVGGVMHASFSFDGKRILTCATDGKLRIWDADSATLLWVIDESQMPLNSLSVSSDGHYLVAGSGQRNGVGGGSILLWDLEPEK